MSFDPWYPRSLPGQNTYRPARIVSADIPRGYQWLITGACLVVMAGVAVKRAGDEAARETQQLGLRFAGWAVRTLDQNLRERRAR